ncbi:MAG: hypothetical protein LBS00_07440 [Synergistaceae bacterium]|nr:hypothetical protein [Synergistaceae bacterium]
MVRLSLGRREATFGVFSPLFKRSEAFRFFLLQKHSTFFDILVEFRKHLFTACITLQTEQPFKSGQKSLVPDLYYEIFDFYKVRLFRSVDLRGASFEP